MPRFSLRACLAGFAGMFLAMLAVATPDVRRLTLDLLAAIEPQTAVAAPEPPPPDPPLPEAPPVADAPQRDHGLSPPPPAKGVDEAVQRLEAEPPAAPPETSRAVLPLTAEIIGPRQMICGELVSLELRESVPAAVRERDWVVTPNYGRLVFDPEAPAKTRGFFSTPEPGLYHFDVVVVHKVHGVVRVSFDLLMTAKPAPAADEEPVEEEMAGTRSVADDVRRAAAKVGAPQAEAREVGSALARAVQGANTGLLSPYNVATEGKAMALLALRPHAGAAERWQPFFRFLDELWSKLEADGVFADPKARVGAMQSVSQILLGRE